jgi:hypothetical protein
MRSAFLTAAILSAALAAHAAPDPDAPRREALAQAVKLARDYQDARARCAADFRRWPDPFRIWYVEQNILIGYDRPIESGVREAADLLKTRPAAPANVARAGKTLDETRRTLDWLQTEIRAFEMDPDAWSKPHPQAASEPAPKPYVLQQILHATIDIPFRLGR